MSQTVNELVSRPSEIRVRGLYPSYKQYSMSQTVNELVSRPNEIRVRGLCTRPTIEIACRKL
jgi:predicted RNA-binding protein YlqC (UPF0109 family)